MLESTIRKAHIQRKTKETDIQLSLALDGLGQASIRTGVGFMNHMLTLFAVHGFFNLEIEAIGGNSVSEQDEAERSETHCSGLPAQHSSVI